MLRTDGVVPSGVGMTAAAGLAWGERAPDLVLPSRDGTPTRYYAHAGGRPALLVFADQACVARLDANLRVRATLPFADGARIAADVAELVGELVWCDRRPREITTQAPLLVVPDVLHPERCAELIAVWEQEGHSETGVESSTGGRRAEQRARS